jgi:hypothetical protein
MVRILEHSRGYYECREVPYGTVYVWCPERFVRECGRGEKTILRGCPLPVRRGPRRLRAGKAGGAHGGRGDTNCPWRPSRRVRSRAKTNFEYDVWQELRALE